jgi:hypothetical protein
MCACLHGWSALWGPPANSPTRILVDEARRYLAQREPKPPGLKQQALAELEQLRGDANSMGAGFDAPAIRRALETLPE